MLVLLIIMMIVAPLLQQGVSVKLPIATNTTEKPETQDQTVVAIDCEQASLPERRAGAEGRPARAASTECSRPRRKSIVIIKADEDVEYSAVMDAMDELRASGIEDMGLITDPRRTSTTAGRRVMASPSAPRRRTGLQGQDSAGQRGHEHHADDRRAARAPRHLHGRPAALAARSRRQPAGGNAAAEAGDAGSSARSC